MTYKTVNFNIFQKNLQDMIFGKDSALNPKNRVSEKSVEFRISKEITLKPLNPKQLESKTLAKV